MWNLNSDTDKWVKKSDTLSKENYDYLKQDLQKVRLWSKCLSGSTYISINNLNDIYEVLNYKKEFTQIDGMLATPNNYSEFYDKYLKDSAFTLKSLFTTSKLIKDQLKNYLLVDVATTEKINISNPIYVLDGIILKEGHRILVKDQISEITLSSSIDPIDYFSNTLKVSNYYQIDNVGGNITYNYYNSENGIYKIISNKLVLQSDLDDYNDSYKYSISVKMGDINKDKQFHLSRMVDGYYPTTNQNCEFLEKHNWILRNRVDYNNIHDLNYYDIIHHNSQTLVIDSITYSIPERTIIVGEFGAIISNQDNFPSTSTYSVSNIIDNKYKLNLNSIKETTKYYWVCGNEGTLLRVSKIDFSIKIIELNEISNLTSISFYDDLKGIVVGKFNTIYYTSDGGFNWEKLTFSEFDSYSYNKVIYNSINSVIVGGESGVFIEFINGIGGWTALKRRISKELSNIDEYLLVDDINDMYKLNWIGIESASYSLDESSSDFASSLIFNNRLSDNYRTLEVSIDSKYFGDTYGTSYINHSYQFSGGVSASGGSIMTLDFYKRPIGISQSTTTYDGSTIVYYADHWQDRGGILGATGYNIGDTFKINTSLFTDSICEVTGVGTYSAPITSFTTITSPGTGYSIGDILKFNGDIIVRVNSIDGLGGVVSFSFLNLGFSTSVLGYSSGVSNIIGSGSGVQFYISGGSIYSGCITSFTILSSGIGYSISSNVSTTAITGIGTGFKVNIDSVNFPYISPVNSTMSALMPSIPIEGDKAILKLNGNTYTYEFKSSAILTYDVEISSTIDLTLSNLLSRITSTTTPLTPVMFVGSSILNFILSPTDYGSIPNSNSDWGIEYQLSSSFTNSEFYISTKITDNNSELIYENPKFSYTSYLPSISDYDLYFTESNTKYSFTVSLPVEFGTLKDNNFLIETNILYNWNATSSISSMSQTYNVSYNINPTSNEFILVSTNNSNVIIYDKNRYISPIVNDFIYCTFTQSLSDIKTISKSIDDDKIYIGGDKVYSFNFSDIFLIGTSSNSVNCSINEVINNYVNKIYTVPNKIYLAGNNSLSNYYDYSTIYEIDPTFNNRIKSKLLFLDYDIASKLNFFTDDGEYRLPDTISITQSYLTSSSSYLSIKNIDNEKNWISYYKDVEKCYTYGGPIDDSNKVEFSTTFSYATFSSKSLISDVYTSYPSDLAPGINNNAHSRTTTFTPVAPSISSTSSVWFYKYLAIFKQNISWEVSIGDVILLESDIVDTTFVVNKIYTYNSYNYIYCYSDLNGSIINSLNSIYVTAYITNLNKYDSISSLIYRFNSHPISIGYLISENDNVLNISSNFNNKTAYYNMQSIVETTIDTKSLLYKESFLNFGYSPTFNIVNYLSNIDSIFTPTKTFYGFGSFDYLTAGELTDDSVWFDYSTDTNLLFFGKNLKFQWTSLLKWTFVNVISIYSSGDQFESNKILIVDKYYDSTYDAYVIKFNKKLPKATSNPLASLNVSFISINSRRTLQEISDDLQVLNNIQRSSTQKEVQTSYTVTNLENEINFKFPTDSYFKGIISDDDIRKKLSGIIYVDSNSQISLNIINLDQVINLDIISISDSGGYCVLNFGTKLHNLNLGDGIIVSNTNLYDGWNTVIEIIDTSKIKIDKVFISNTTGDVSYTKKDPFLNYQPIDLFNYGTDQKIDRSIKINPENVVNINNKYNIVNIDLDKYKMIFVDGLYLDEIERKYPWFLEAEISNAIIGKDNNGLIWYSGIWHCGRWFGGTWISGRWISGDWYSGIWKSLKTTFKIISVDISSKTIDNSLSKWYSGRWFGGTWFGGTWYNGRKYDGTWYNGVWYNGIWNNGLWIDGVFSGGVWVQGKWESGLFNCNSKPSYWIDGEFISGDFENGMWYNGKFGNTQNLLSRFGTKSTNSRTTTWHGGDWINGQFHSYLNSDSQTNMPSISDIHKYTIWYTGNWYGGDFWGGIAYNINFYGGNWHGGILEDIQVSGIDSILPEISSNNAITLNGVFRFNIGNNIWIINNEQSTPFYNIGNNDTPMNYRINNVELDTINKKTKIYLNYNLSTLGVDTPYDSTTYSNVDTGLRVVSYFKNATWESGIWTSGIFDSGNFNSGIWYNGVFSANWGN